MIINMRNEDFKLIRNIDIGQGCFNPLIKIYKSRISEQFTDDHTSIKEKFFQELNEGQRALFMFYTYYNHASKSLIEFYWWSAYFIAQSRSWDAIKYSLKFFENEALLQLLEKIEVELKKHNHPVTLEQFRVTREDLGRNQKLLLTFELLYISFEKISPLAIRKINEYIEQNLEEFVQLEE